MIQFYDNNYRTVDRYSMVVQEGELYHCYNFSTDATQPDGINMYGGTYSKDEFKHISEDTPITWYDLPLQVQIACLQRLDPRE